MSATLAPRPRRADHDCLRLTTAFLVFFLFTLRALAGQVSLAWNPSPDSRVIGYNVHYGTQSGSYTAAHAAGSSTSTTVPNLTAGQTYYFVVRARDAAGTESANSNQVSATIPAAAPVASASIISANPTTGPAPLTVAFSGKVTGATNYVWKFGDSVTSLNTLNTSHTYSNAGTDTKSYTATFSATDVNGNVLATSNPIVIAVAPVPTNSQAPNGTIVSPSSNTSVATGTSVQFAGSGTGSNTPLTYSWDFGNGSTSTSQNPRVTFNSAKSYQVKLTVSDSKNVADATPATVTINVGSSGTSSGSTGTTSVTLGETSVLPLNDSGNGNLLVVQDATLAKTATLQSLSFYVKAASGNLRLGVYDATGPGGGPGALKAQTNAFTPVVGWNTAKVISAVALPAGNYWLAYFPSSSSLHFAWNSSIGKYRYAELTFGPMPAKFPTVNGQGGSHWSLYGTLTP